MNCPDRSGFQSVFWRHFPILDPPASPQTVHCAQWRVFRVVLHCAVHQLHIVGLHCARKSVFRAFLHCAAGRNSPDLLKTRGLTRVSGSDKVTDVGNQSKIDAVAAGQYGVFNTAQCAAAGFDKDAIRRRRLSGKWLRLAPTVYAVASSPAKWERSVASAILSRPIAYVSGSTAAYLHGFRSSSQGRPVIVVPESSNARSDIARVIRHRRFEELETTRIAGFQTTSVEETLVLLGRQYSASRLAAIVDDLLIRQQIDLAKAQGILERETDSRVKGLSTVRALIEERLPTAPSVDGSYLERLLELLLRRSDVTGWTREFPFTIRGRPARVDFYFEHYRLIVEADGRAWHARFSDFEDDRIRDNDLTARGIRVLRFTHRMLADEPDTCIRTIHDVAGSSITV